MEESEIKVSVRDLLSSDDRDGKSVRALLSDHTPPSQRQVQPNLFQELVIRDPSRDGKSLMITGDTGFGKTALLISIIKGLFSNKRQVKQDLREGKMDEDVKWEYEQIAAEKIFWIGDVDCQWRRLPESATPRGGPPDRASGKLFLVEDGLKPEFFLNGNPIQIKSVPFKDFADVVAYAQPHKFNIVYIRDPLDVMDFIQYLITTSLGEWATVCVDEMEDVCPAYMRKDNWRRAEEFSKRLAKARKRRKSFYATLQSDSQLDWRVPNIVPHRGLCPGAKRPKGWEIFKWVCGHVPLGQAHIATYDNFQKISYSPYTKKGTMVVRGLTMWEELKDAREKAKGPTTPPTQAKAPPDSKKPTFLP